MEQGTCGYGSMCDNRDTCPETANGCMFGPETIPSGRGWDFSSKVCSSDILLHDYCGNIAEPPLGTETESKQNKHKEPDAADYAAPAVDDRDGFGNASTVSGDGPAGASSEAHQESGSSPPAATLKIILAIVALLLLLALTVAYIRRPVTPAPEIDNAGAGSNFVSNGAFSSQMSYPEATPNYEEPHGAKSSSLDAGVDALYSEVDDDFRLHGPESGYLEPVAVASAAAVRGLQRGAEYDYTYALASAVVGGIDDGCKLHGHGTSSAHVGSESAYREPTAGADPSGREHTDYDVASAASTAGAPQRGVDYALAGVDDVSVTYDLAGDAVTSTADRVGGFEYDPVREMAGNNAPEAEAEAESEPDSEYLTVGGSGSKAQPKVFKASEGGLQIQQSFVSDGFGERPRGKPVREFKPSPQGLQKKQASVYDGFGGAQEI